MQSQPPYVGIDVAKAHLDGAAHPSGAKWRHPYDEAGTSQLVAHLQELKPVLVVLEATGGLELPLVAALAAAGLR
jgi:transposase